MNQNRNVQTLIAPLLKSSTTFPNDISIKLGEFSVLDLNGRSSINKASKPCLAYIMYNGIASMQDEKYLCFEIGPFNSSLNVQQGKGYLIPTTEKIIDEFVKSYRKRIKLEILQYSPLEVRARNLIKNQYN
jgi:hypothetical protein